MSSPRFPSVATDSSPLFEPLAFHPSGRTAPNRFLHAAMSEALATWHPTAVQERGIPTPELINLYRHWGAGGWGQILTGNIQIHPEHLEAPGNAIISLDAPFSGPRFEAFQQLATAAKLHGSLIVGQVSHPGRQMRVFESVQTEPISASDIQVTAPNWPSKFAKPRPATREDIQQIIEGFAHAAEYLEKAGFDGIQLHGAHGYLIAQFLSPSTNKRTDQYGGSSENRMRLLLEIFAAIKARVSKSFIIGIKANAIEYKDEGSTVSDAQELCVALENVGFDYVELSGGNYEKYAWVHRDEEAKKLEGYFIPQAKEIKPLLKGTLKLYVTGGFLSLDGMLGALSVADGVGLGRPACQEPRFPKELQSQKLSGVLKFSVPDSDLISRLSISQVQIRQIAKNQEPVDISVPENCAATMKEIMAHAQKREADKTGWTIGSPDLTIPSIPYKE